jgi:EamA domain-containing membrane protein RarD
MELAILLSLAASLCTAISSVCQRLGARHLEQCGEMRDFDAWLVFRLARPPMRLLGFAYMIAGFCTVAMLLTLHAIAPGPLAASQPGFTIGDPLTAILLGVFVFKESLGTSPGALAAEVAGLVVLALGVRTLSGSALITHTTQPRRPASGEAISRELTRRSR